MSHPSRVKHPHLRPLATDVPGFAALAELALDMRWSWSHATDAVWRRLDPELWGSTHNPWVVLQTVARDRIERVCADPAIREDIEALVQSRRRALDAPAWFQRTHAPSALTCAAYF
ncbi:MAG TPA: DUF3417 domain-containing protein, partial [Polyangiaceae bacterium]|nr:DUF3417 domain-containing protein [Polyangiaceae bacterium]